MQKETNIEVNSLQFISHIRKDINGKIIAFQSNEEHCHNVAELAKQFAGEFKYGEFDIIKK